MFYTQRTQRNQDKKNILICGWCHSQEIRQTQEDVLKPIKIQEHKENFNKLECKRMVYKLTCNEALTKHELVTFVRPASAGFSPTQVTAGALV